MVSKPHLRCIEELCRDLRPYRDRLLFRFTITARNAAILRFWEPQAPTYAERLACLELAFRQGFATSVSVEPMLDTADVVAMVDELQPFVTHSIWLGKMNRIAERVGDADRSPCRPRSRELKKARTMSIFLKFTGSCGIIR